MITYIALPPYNCIRVVPNETGSTSKVQRKNKLKNEHIHTIFISWPLECARAIFEEYFIKYSHIALVNTGSSPSDV